MKELEERININGMVINNDILKVDSFINHQIDVHLLRSICHYIHGEFEKPTKILTIETSGIAFAIGVAYEYDDIPVVFAKKSKSKTVDVSNIYTSEVKSFTRGTTSTILVDKRFLCRGDKILIVDDFLAEGNASFGLIDLCKQAGCEILGVAVAVEKGFQNGRARLEEAGYRVISAANIDHFENGKCVFR